MDEVLKKRLEEKDGHIPMVEHYADLLFLITDKLDITFETARKRYGLFTYAQWAKLLEQ